jgi:hypothetical protein
MDEHYTAMKTSPSYSSPTKMKHPVLHAIANEIAQLIHDSHLTMDEHYTALFIESTLNSDCPVTIIKLKTTNTTTTELVIYDDTHRTGAVTTLLIDLQDPNSIQQIINKITTRANAHKKAWEHHELRKT